MGSASEPVLLLDQDRSSWDRVPIRRGLAALARAEWLGGALGPYGLRAAIAACHPGDTGECPGRGARVSRLRAFGALRRGGRRHRRREQSHEIGRRLRIAFDAQRAVAHRLRERTALGFYGAIFGWEFAGPGPMPGDPPGSYYVARMHGDDVAGIASAPASGAPERPGWNTHVAVDRADDAAGRARAAGGRCWWSRLTSRRPGAWR